MKIRVNMESGGGQATRSGRFSNPSVRVGTLGGASRPNPAGEPQAPAARHRRPPPPRLTTASPTMAVLLSWARQASTNADPFGGPGRGPCWVGGEGRSEKGFRGLGASPVHPLPEEQGAVPSEVSGTEGSSRGGPGAPPSVAGAVLGAGGLRGGQRGGWT